MSQENLATSGVAVAGISLAIRQKKIFLDKEAINRTVEEMEEVLGVVEMV